MTHRPLSRQSPPTAARANKPTLFFGFVVWIGAAPLGSIVQILSFVPRGHFREAYSSAT